MKIIKAVKKDERILLSLRRDFMSFHDGLAGRRKSTGWEKEYSIKLQKELVSPKVLKLLAVETGDIIGVVFCEIVANPPGTGAWIEAKQAGLIKNLYIKREFRGRGIGTALINECMKWLRTKKIRMAELAVAINNDSARRLYKNLGFKDVSYRMRKTL